MDNNHGRRQQHYTTTGIIGKATEEAIMIGAAGAELGSMILMVGVVVAALHPAVKCTNE